MREGEWNVSLSSLTSTMVASQLNDVIPLLEAAEAASRSGKYVAVMLCYEAAPVFDSAFISHPPSSLPLAWAGIFDECDKEIWQAPDYYSATEWVPQVSRLEYNNAIRKIRDLIAAGHTYQVNYTFPLHSIFSGDALGWYHNLCEAQGARYSAFLDLGRYQILSLSPELFFERTKNDVRTKPMKGTARRGRWLQEDQELASSLAESDKDRAENVMIVDLLRNDLGKVSTTGSVKVTTLFDVERFETLWQMTSTVESTLKPGTGLVELMRALFPCGSITGAPKIRTMEIIRQLEPHARGIYTGTIGLLRPGGDCKFNVAIRTLVVDSETGQASFGVGGGITIGSTAESEYEECIVKTHFLSAPTGKFGLFETMLLEDSQVFLLDRHLHRLKNSAEYFGFEFPASKIASDIEALRLQHPEGAFKVRLTLSKDGATFLECDELGEIVNSGSSNKPDNLRVTLSTLPVDSSNRFLFHKTTRRDFYTSQLRANPNCDDVLFYNERGAVTESALANVVVELDGRLFTPPVTAGLLAGTFRTQLLADREIEERTIKVEELKNASRIFLINSVRKWMRATLVQNCEMSDAL